MKINSAKIQLNLIIFLMCGLLYTQENSQPNIVLINVDDMGWKDLGFMGSNYYESPNIDQLASKGVVFSNGYASAANCAPSRASLMTGLWTPRHGIYTVGSSKRGNTEDRKLVPSKNKTILSTSFKVLPQILKENGYTTCHSGKWHLSNDPKSFGFDVNIGGSHAGYPKSYTPPYQNVKIEMGKNRFNYRKIHCIYRAGPTAFFPVLFPLCCAFAFKSN